MVTYKIKRQDIIKLRSYVTLFWFVDMNIILISFSPMDLNFKCLGYNLTSNFYFERIYKVFTASIYIKKKQKQSLKQVKKWDNSLIKTQFRLKNKSNKIRL